MKLKNVLITISVASLFVACTPQISKSNTETVVSKNVSDQQLMDLVQKQTLKYFWDFAEQSEGYDTRR